MLNCFCFLNINKSSCDLYKLWWLAIDITLTFQSKWKWKIAVLLLILSFFYKINVSNRSLFNCKDYLIVNYSPPHLLFFEWKHFEKLATQVTSHHVSGKRRQTTSISTIFSSIQIKPIFSSNWVKKLFFNSDETIFS